MRGGVVIFQLSFLASTLASTGLRFTEEPAFALFKRWNARRIGNLTFHFKTESKNGFLIYQDDRGQCEYIYLSMADGQLRLRLKMGTCEKTQTLHVGHRLNDGRWHKVTVQRDSAVTRLTVDNLSNSTIYNGKEKSLTVKSDLIVGGIPWFTQLNDLSFPPVFYESNHYGFNGCISRITYNVKRRPREAYLKATNGTTLGCLDPCSKTRKCKNGAVCRYNFIEAHCDCKGTRFEGINCSEETSSIWLNGSGYVVFRARQEAKDFDSNENYLGFHLKTFSYHGVIFTLLSRYHHLLIEMVRGKLKVELSLGQDRVVFSGRHQVNDGEWHWVEFYWEHDVFRLMIDHNPNYAGEVSSRHFKPTMVYVAGGPRNVIMRSESNQNYSGYLQECYLGKKKIFDSIIPTITDRRFAKIGTVIDGSITFEGSGGSGCLLLRDDEDEECPTNETSRTPTEVELTTTTTQLTTEQVPKQAPTGVPALKSLPQVVPFWVISAIVVVAAIAISVTLLFLYRWNSRYSGSFKPEPSSSSCMSSPKHDAFVINPRIRVTLHDDRM